MRLGRSAPDALKALISTDADAAVRQVAMIDAHGEVAVHTGNRNIAAAGHKTGKQYSVQANLMEKPTVWAAMGLAYESSQGDLAERLLAALEAAEREGGDLRGRQSAAFVIVSAENTGQPWRDRIFDLRVEDHPQPVNERAYLKLNEGDEWLTQKNIAKALKAYDEATNIVPDIATNGEAVFWTGITLADAGRVDEAIPYLRRAYAQHPEWRELIPRLPAAGLLPDDRKLITELVEKMRQVDKF